MDTENNVHNKPYSGGSGGRYGHSEGTYFNSLEPYRRRARQHRKILAVIAFVSFMMLLYHIIVEMPPIHRKPPLTYEQLYPPINRSEERR